MARKSNKGQINFFRFMAVVGGVGINLGVREFFGAGPPLSLSQAHKSPPSSDARLNCHVQKAENTPIMPHRPMDNCTFCHKPPGIK